jgi:hypothetical protein
MGGYAMWMNGWKLKYKSAPIKPTRFLWVDSWHQPKSHGSGKEKSLIILDYGWCRVVEYVS